MMDNYEKDLDPEKNETYTLEECKKEWGLIDVSDHHQKESVSGQITRQCYIQQSAVKK